LGGSPRVPVSEGSAGAAGSAGGMADGPLFCMHPSANSGAPADASSQSATFAEHAERFTKTCDGFRAVCDGVGAGSDSEVLRTQGELLVLELKRSARDLHDSLRQGVDSSDQARDKVDGVAVRVRCPPTRHSTLHCSEIVGCARVVTGQLHELAYEKGHLEREIAFERKFGSAHEQIVLPSADDMRAQGASSTAAEAGEHQLMLELLAYELSLREQLVGEERSLAKRTKELHAQVARKRKLLEDELPHQLSELCAAAKPLVSFAPEAGQAPDSVALGRGDESDRLPPPLFTLVSQFEAYRDEFVNASDADMTIRILGDATTIRDDPPGPASPTSKLRRKDPPSRTSALEPFPLWAEVTHRDSKHGTLRLTFTYLPQLKLLAADGEWEPSVAAGKPAKKLSGPELLAQLFEGDQGLELPSPASVHVLGCGSWPVADAEAAASSAAHAIGRPYRWLQWFGGLYVPRPSASAAPSTADQQGLLSKTVGIDDEGKETSWSVYATLGRMFDLVGVK
jgi:hypothetical protein